MAQKTGKSRVKKVTTQNPDQYGNPSFIVEFDDGISGFYKGKKDREPYFKEGVEAEYICEELLSKTGKPYNKISPPPSAQQNNQGKKGFNSFKDHKKDTISYSMSYAKDLCVGGKIEEKQMIPTAEKLFNWMIEKLDSLDKPKEVENGAPAN